MAKGKKQKTRKSGGPYLAAAVFCDNIVEGADHSLSVIRIVDRVTISIPANAPADVPSEKHRLPVAIWALIAFKTGYAKRRHDLQLIASDTSGNRAILQKQQLTLSSEPNGGWNLKAHITLVVIAGGLYWVDVSLDGKVVTRMPIQVIIKRVDTPTAPAKKR